MVARPGREELPTGRVARAVQVQRYPDDLEVAEDLAVCFLLDLADEAVHRLRDLGKVAPKPLTVESRRHRFVLLGADVDDACDCLLYTSPSPRDSCASRMSFS